MQVAPSGGHICNYCTSRHLVAKFATNVSGAIFLPRSIQVMESISGSVVPLAMFFHGLATDELSVLIEEELQSLF